MKKLAKQWMPLIAFALLAGCAATPVQHYTPSAKPEVTINTTEVSVVKASLISTMLNLGFDLKKDTNYQLVFERPITDILTAALFGSQYDRTPNARITYTLAASPKSVRVIVDLAVITNPGSAFERRTPANHYREALEYQGILDNLRREIEAFGRPLGRVEKPAVFA